MTQDDLDVLVDSLAPVLKEFVEHALQPIRARITELEAATPEYKGVWDAGALYGRGALVTFQGLYWYATTASVSRPPGTSSEWTLADKIRSVAS